NKLIDELAEGLRKQRLSGGQWRSTQDNMYALVALSDYARAQKNGVTEIAVGGALTRNRVLRGGEVLFEEFDGSKIRQPLTIQARGRARYAVRVREAKRGGLDQIVNNGLSVTREYLTADGKKLESIKAGQLVKVRLTVAPGKERRWLALADPLPAGFEAVNTRLASSASTVRTGRSWSWTHVEMRDDQVLAFADRVWRGRPMVLEYLARATIAGKFKALPAHAETMYAPEINGRTAQSMVTIR
ncbi:MAG: hypothetical protein KJO07_02510, partial [Deltaproteobacteria bacterium]|nr:hypothetical protein [Deltaproteobacteria bacterium]